MKSLMTAAILAMAGASAQANDAYIVSTLDQCNKVKENTSFEEGIDVMQKLSANNPDQFSIIQDETFPEGRIVTFKTHDGELTIANNLNLCREILSFAEKARKSTAKRQIAWTIDYEDGKTPYCGPSGFYDYAQKTFTEDKAKVGWKILFNGATDQGQKIVIKPAMSDGLIYYFDNEDYCNASLKNLEENHQL